MAKKNNKRRKANGFTIPVAVAAPITMVGFKTGKIAIYNGIEDGMHHLTQVMTGFDMRDNIEWHWETMKQGLIPIAIGLLAHKIAAKVGINRAIGRAGIPWLRI